MAKKWLTGLSLVLLLPLVVRAGEADKPTVVARVRSLDALVDHVKLLVTLAGREEIAKQVEGLIKAKIGVQGLEGIDPTRPFGVYARFGKELDDVAGAILIPIADEKAFLDLLDNLNHKASKGKNDIYTVQTGTPIDVYLRFANRYAYVTALNASALEGKLVQPSDILGKDGPTFAATVRLEQLPDAARQLAIAQVEQDLQNLAAKKQPNETPGQQQVRSAAAKELAKVAIALLKDGGELNLAIDLSAPSKELSIKVSASGKEGSELARSIQTVGQGQSLFGAWRGAESAFRGAIHVVLPEELKKGVSKLLDEGFAESLGKIQDAAKRQQAQQLIDALAPTLKSGELDACAQLLGPNADKKYALVAAVRVKDGAKLGGTLRDLVADLLKQVPEAQRSKIQLDHAVAGDVKIHRLELPDDKGTRDLAQVVGETNLYVAFRDDAAFVAVGKDSLAALKDLIGAKTTGAGPVLSWEVDVARLAPVLAPTEELRAAAQKIFPGGKDGAVRILLEGGPALRLSISTRLPVVQFLSQVREMKGGN